MRLSLAVYSVQYRGGIQYSIIFPRDVSRERLTNSSWRCIFEFHPRAQGIVSSFYLNTVFAPTRYKEFSCVNLQDNSLAKEDKADGDADAAPEGDEGGGLGGVRRDDSILTRNLFYKYIR